MELTRRSFLKLVAALPAAAVIDNVFATEELMTPNQVPVKPHDYDEFGSIVLKMADGTIFYATSTSTAKTYSDPQVLGATIPMPVYRPSILNVDLNVTNRTMDKVRSVVGSIQDINIGIIEGKYTHWIAKINGAIISEFSISSVGLSDVGQQGRLTIIFNGLNIDSRSV